MPVSQEDVVRRVRALWAKAEDPAATEPEKAAATAKARDLMAKWAISEIELDAASETHEAIVIRDILLFETADANETLVPEQRRLLAHYLAIHNRCKDIGTEKEASIYDDGTAQLAGEYLLVIGYRSDVHMVELLYQSLMSDMIVAFYRTDLRHVKSKRQRENIMVNFCDGYVHRIAQRLAEINRTVHEMAESDGSLLPVLRSRENAVSDFFEQMYPPEERVTEFVKGFVYDPGAQAAGAAAADKASLGGKAVGGRKEALGGG